MSSKGRTLLKSAFLISTGGFVLFKIYDYTHICSVVNSMNDRSAARKHKELLAHLHKHPICHLGPDEDELKCISTDYYDSYLHRAVNHVLPLRSKGKDAQKEIPVFSLLENVKIETPKPITVDLPLVFALSGTLNSLQNSQAYKDINNGNYTRCKLGNHQAVVITGSPSIVATNRDICREFEKQLLRSTLIRNAINVHEDKKHLINKDALYMDTPLFATKELTAVGDISELNKDMSKEILTDNYVVCSYVGYRKTRISNGAYVELPGVVLGTHDRSSCDTVFFRQVAERLDREALQL